MLEMMLSVLIVVGALFTFVGSLGLARLDDFYTRLHGPTKATTLGVGALLIASVLYFSTRGEGLSLHEVLVTLFLFITPRSARTCLRRPHCICACARLHRRRPRPRIRWPIPASGPATRSDRAPSAFAT